MVTSVAVWLRQFESLLSILTHITCGTIAILHERSLRKHATEALRHKRPNQKPRFSRRAPSARIHRLTGLCMAPLVVVHVGIVHLQTPATAATQGYAHLAALAALYPVSVPASLVLLTTCASYHVAYGMWMALINLGALPPGRPRILGRRVAVGLGLLLLFTALTAIVHL